MKDIEKAFSQNPNLLARLSELDNANIFITGGTGFFGCWLLESLAWMQARGLKFRVTLLTRNPQVFKKKYPRLASLSFVTFHTGDIRSFDFPSERYSHLIHAATDTNVKLHEEQPLEILDTIVNGTRRALDFALHSGVSKFLLTSSGAVYGRQNPNVTHVSEECQNGPDPLSPKSSYGEGKRISEFLCSAYSGRSGLETKIARCFAFVGPYLPLDGHFAIGNFIRDAMEGRSIEIKGDGTPWRSYLYGADLAAWLWSILLLGKTCRAYNVGSEDLISITDLAKTVSEVLSPGLKAQVQKKATPGKVAERYVPSTQRAQKELGLKQSVDLKEAIKKTADWHAVALK